MNLAVAINDLFLRGGLNKEQFNAIRYKMVEDNLKMWRIFSVFVFVIFTALSISSFILEVVILNRIAYLAMALYGAVIVFIFHKIIKKPTKAVLALVYITCTMIFLFAAYTSINDPEELSVTFMVLLVILPITMIDRPCRIAVLTMLSTIVFIVLVAIYKAESVAVIDLYDALVFSILGILTNTYFLYNRFNNYKLNEELNKLAYVDLLTGLNNETAYFLKEDELRNKIKNGNAEFAFIILDVNNVKLTNDSYGHRFGAYLIATAGKIIRDIFVGGNHYHVGGDEFIVVLEGEAYENCEALLKEFDERLSFSKLVMEDTELVLSVARGVCIYKPGERFKTVFHKADQAMYKNKAEVKEKYGLSDR